MGLVPVEDVLTVYTQTILPSMPEWDAESEESDGEDSSADNFAKPLEKYLDYFEATWLGAINKRTNVRGKPVKTTHRTELRQWEFRTFLVVKDHLKKQVGLTLLVRYRKLLYINCNIIPQAGFQ